MSGEEIILEEVEASHSALFKMGGSWNQLLRNLFMGWWKEGPNHYEGPASSSFERCQFKMLTCSCENNKHNLSSIAAKHDVDSRHRIGLFSWVYAKYCAD